jgi:hypothetical protein
MRARSGARAILWGGLAAGTLDLAAALVLYGLRGARPIRILQAISSGLLGAAAFQGGAATAALGVALHFLIAFGAAAVYFAASRKLGFLVRHAVPWGLAYGVGVYLFMNTVVLPLSAVARRPFALDPTLILVHMLCVGLPIALAVRRYAPESGAVRAA